MSDVSVTTEGTLQEDGQTLRLDTKASLPPGRVRVTVQAVATASGPTMLEVLDRIHHDQRRGGRRPMTEEEMAAEIAATRREDDDYEERWRELWSQTGTPPEATDGR
jgi:hypothetical protein